MARALLSLIHTEQQETDMDTFEMIDATILANVPGGCGATPSTEASAPASPPVVREGTPPKVPAALPPGVRVRCPSFLPPRAPAQ
jgi:hypothetical protein